MVPKANGIPSRGEPEATEAMKAGTDHHAKLEQEIDRYTRDWLLALCGNSLFPNSTGITVKASWLQYLEDLDKVQNYTCGAAVLGFLYRNISEFVLTMDNCDLRGFVLIIQVIQKGGVHLEEIEDFWAMKFLNFIFRANQLLNEGLTRELPLVGFVHGVWMVGSIDELQHFANESVQNARLVESKTRSRSSLPPEAQKRNGRLQLMCYKHIWDNIASNFPLRRFYDHFELSPHHILSEEVQVRAAASGHRAKSFDDIVTYYRSRCATLPPSHNELLLRYIFQGDGSLLEEEKFTCDSELFMSQLKRSLEFWSGEQPPSYVSEEDLWKCLCCSFSDVCPVQR